MCNLLKEGDRVQFGVRFCELRRIFVSGTDSTSLGDGHYIYTMNNAMPPAYMLPKMVCPAKITLLGDPHSGISDSPGYSIFQSAPYPEVGWAENRFSRDIALRQYLVTMTWLRRVLIQDVAVLFSKDPLALIFKFAPFNALSFRNFAAISTAAIHLNSAEEARLAFQNLPQHLVASMQGALATQNLAFERERQNYQVQMDVMHSKMGQMQSLLELVAGSKRTKMSHGPSLTNLDVPRFAHAEPAPLGARPRRWGGTPLLGLLSCAWSPRESACDAEGRPPAPCVPSSVAVLVAEELGSMLLFLGFPTDAQFMDILTSENKGQPEAQLLTAGLSLFRPV
ncbi:hypothetical protein DFH09DRAFT_1445281 [Mycena vulgaris]|nr:hypothetical protein DFH09DRAFT_1445281 [Mycena vulgaris]